MCKRLASINIKKLRLIRMLDFSSNIRLPIPSSNEQSYIPEIAFLSHMTVYKQLNYWQKVD